MTLIASPVTSVETIASSERLEELAGEWDDLVRAMPRPSPFLLHGWLAEWWRHYGDRAELALEVVRRDGRLVGALPMVVRRRAGLRVGGFPGGPCAVLSDLLLAPDADASVARRLTESLAARCHVVDVHGLPAGSRIATALGSELTLIERIEAPVLDLTGGWDAVYRAKTNSKKRNQHQRRRRQLGELGRLTVTVARRLDELEPALEEAFRLHALRWEGRPDGSDFATPTGQRFHRAALRRLAAIDVPRIVTLRLDGRAIAFHYWFALEGRMYVHRLAFDPALGRLSPGLVNTLDALESAAGEGLERVEYLGGGERYKLELADGCEPLYQGFGASGVRGRAYVAAHLGVVHARLRLKRSPRLHRLYLDDLAPLRRAANRIPRARGAR
jgi:CelD/BcsL family acetyltransferase involved in cellulose biosynthesis